MPGRDGTGPAGTGSFGPGGGRGRLAAGRDGHCVCPSCGHRSVHQVGQPCTEQVCPKCGSRMIRE
ncbi:MAG: hypothetical protein EOM13_05885 [Clostridia bacterium]|nr:hypothetical protein [Clostridia bacterium]